MRYDCYECMHYTDLYLLYPVISLIVYDIILQWTLDNRAVIAKIYEVDNQENEAKKQNTIAIVCNYSSTGNTYSLSQNVSRLRGSYTILIKLNHVSQID